MTTETVEVQSVGAERLRGLVARWRSLAEFPEPHRQGHRSGWAEHLRRVADEHERSEMERNSSNESLEPAAAPVEEKPPVDQDNSHAFLRPILRPLAL
jgi:hypothetical protein